MSLGKRVGLGTERLQSSFQQLGMGLAVFTSGAVMVGGAIARAPSMDAILRVRVPSKGDLIEANCN